MSDIIVIRTESACGGNGATGITVTKTRAATMASITIIIARENADHLVIS